MRAFACAVLTALAIGVRCGADAHAPARQPWLFVSDVHFEPSLDRQPSENGTDTNDALLSSALAEMRRVAPDPPVVVIPGDFLGHHLPRAAALPTMTALAKRFGTAFPHSQFVIALGNEDSDCGDYGMTTDSAFLLAVARAWEPLVNRNDAAPEFVRTFSHDGFYVARLPVSKMRAVVIDDVFWSPFRRTLCPQTGNPADATSADLEAALGTAGSDRRWLIMHIPPGVDIGTTSALARDLITVPFLQPAARDRVLALAADPARRVDAVITGHMHRLSVRVIGAAGTTPVPLLIVPAVSPIFGNLPSFLTADVARDGRIRNVEEHALVRGRWRDAGGFASLHVRALTGSELLALQARITARPDERLRFATLYAGPIRWNEINAVNWPGYVCAMTNLDATSFRACTREPGFRFLSRRALVFAGIFLLAVIAGLAWLAATIRRRRRTPPASGS